MTDRIERTTGLVPGDTLIVAVQLRGSDGREFWWKRFCCVVDVVNSRQAVLLSLKMQIEPDSDVRLVDFTRDVVTKLDDDKMPQGVAAMRMKWIAKGVIKVGE